MLSDSQILSSENKEKTGKYANKDQLSKHLSLSQLPLFLPC